MAILRSVRAVFRQTSKRATGRKIQYSSTESVDDFITDVYRLAEHCEFSELHNEMVRDRIVVGIKDSQLSEKMQLDRKLTLEKAVSMAPQSETVKQQQTVVREGHTAHEGDSQSVDSIQKGDHRRGWRPRAAGGSMSAQNHKFVQGVENHPNTEKDSVLQGKPFATSVVKRDTSWSKQGDNKVGVVSAQL